MRKTEAQINLNALQHNIKQIKNLQPNARILSVIKADAYGHGVANVIAAIDEYSDGFGVATVEEAIQARKILNNMDANKVKPVVIFSSFLYEDECQELIHYKLTPVIHSIHQINELEKHFSSNKDSQQIKVWLKIDTGMNRWGIDVFNDEELLDRLTSLINSNHLKVKVVMTHFACADEMDNSLTELQYENFKKVMIYLKRYHWVQNVATSLQNSAAIAHWKNITSDWIRPGRMLYGSSPVIGVSHQHYNLQAAMQFKSRVTHIKNIKKGEKVGYGQTFTAEKDSLIAYVPCGYADGYPRNMQSGAPVVVINQLGQIHRVQIAGRVSMDALTIDISGANNIKVGDVVILWGNELSADELEVYSHSISHELLSRVSARVPRNYHLTNKSK